MEPLKNSSVIFNSILPFGDFLYILQQEEYSSQRYWKWLGRFFFRRNFQVRGHLLYTARAKITLCFAILLWLIAIIISAASLPATNILLALLSVAVCFLLIPIFILIANLILSPFFTLAKRRVIRRVAKIVSAHGGLKIIGVAGSFGKTTTKNFIYELIRYNYKTQLIPENINTTLGIANWVDHHLHAGTEILIVEMDAYHSGEIAASCAITPPEIAIITNIGDQHIERFGNKENLARTLNEIFACSNPSAQLLCTAETADQLPAKNNSKLILVDPSTLAIIASHPDVAARFSDSNLGNLAFAMRTAELLAISQEFILDTCKKVELPDRRQKMIVSHGYECIDDSYNISFTTAQAGIAFASAAAQVKKKKLLVVTAGIPELGPDDQDKNETLGKMLFLKADRAALLKSMFYKEIEKGIPDARRYVLFNDLEEFWKKSKELFPPEQWLLLLQPELTDLYY
jgi:UDP-N-acetylmuramoyl-tripeptide--D-alanyl-D-alanine ligase